MQIKSLRHKVTCTILVGVIAISLVGCSSDSDKTGSVTPSVVSEDSVSMPVEPADVSIPKTVERIMKKDGWIQIEISKSRVKIPRKPVESEDGVFMSTLIPKDASIVSLSCGSDVTEPEMVKRCGEFPFGADYQVYEVTVSDIGGRPFCYRVSAAKVVPSDRGGMHLFTFLDEDRDGVIETILLRNAGCEIASNGH